MSAEFGDFKRAPVATPSPDQERERANLVAGVLREQLCWRCFGYGVLDDQRRTDAVIECPTCFGSGRRV